MYTQRSVDLAWTAGVFDGEGTIVISGAKSKRRVHGVSHCLHIRVVMTHEVSVRLLKKFCGMGSVVFISSNKQKNAKKDSWAWTVNSKKSALVLQMLLPYLRTKKEEALVAIEFSKTLLAHGGKQRLTDEAVEKREELRLKLNSLR